MIKINLLYRSVEEKEKKTNIARQMVIFVIASVVFALLLASVQLYVVQAIMNLESEIKTKEERLVVLKKVIGEIDDIKAEKKILEKKLAVIRRLEEDRLFPIRLLDEVNALVPAKDVRLTKVSEQGPQLSIEGVGRDNIAVALFMKSLELSKYIQSVDLISSKQVDLSGIKVQQFSLSCVKKRS
ncbi:MAG: PilN domain-containing protein [Deltaproteobacteria bacterium]|nr:PilN domain-containing protein [Deltaproteobacteria bacterium]